MDHLRRVNKNNNHLILYSAFQGSQGRFTGLGMGGGLRRVGQGEEVIFAVLLNSVREAAERM